MRYATVLVIGLGLLMSGCSSHDEVSRVTSPDGAVDALVFETNCGTPCSFGYEVELGIKGSPHGEQVASLDGATRNGQAWGVNLKWLSPDSLSVEYLRAEDARLLRQRVAIAGHDIAVSLRGGVNDPSAPAGGMAYNRK